MSEQDLGFVRWSWRHNCGPFLFAVIALVLSLVALVVVCLSP